MSFTNDDERDGLASLFGGITPQGAPPTAPSTTEAADPRDAATVAEPPVAPPFTVPPAAAAPVAPSGAPLYPGLEPAAPPPVHSAPPVYTPPVYTPPVATPPAYVPEPPTFESPSSAPPSAQPSFPTPAYSPPTYTAPAYTPPVYAAPVEPRAAEPTGPFGEPVAPAYGQPTEPPVYGQPQPTAAPQYLPPEPYVPPAYVPPVTPQPGAGAPSAPPSYDLPPPSYDLPAPAAAPATSTYPGLPPGAETAPAPAPEYPGIAATPVAYPPTAQYPAGLEPAAAFDPPVSAVPPSEPQPLAEPPAFGGGFAALGLDEPDAARPDLAPPGATPKESAFAAESPTASAFDPTPQAAAPSAVVEAPRDRSSAVLRRPPGPLLPTERPEVESSEDIARSTTFEKIGLGLAVVGGPLGLILAIVNGIRGVRRRGWLIGVGRASIILAVVSTIAAGIGGVTLGNIRQAQLEHAQVAAASAEFCAAADENPQLVDPPLLGWPEPGDTITDSITSIEEWTTRWTDLAAVSPEGLRNGLELLATNGGQVLTAVQQTRLVNNAENERVMANAAGSSGVAGWYTTYCVAP